MSSWGLAYAGRPPLFALTGGGKSLKRPETFHDRKSQVFLFAHTMS